MIEKLTMAMCVAGVPIAQGLCNLQALVCRDKIFLFGKNRISRRGRGDSNRLPKCLSFKLFVDFNIMFF